MLIFSSHVCNVVGSFFQDLGSWRLIALLMCTNDHITINIRTYIIKDVAVRFLWHFILYLHCRNCISKRAKAILYMISTFSFQCIMMSPFICRLFAWPMSATPIQWNNKYSILQNLSSRKFSMWKLTDKLFIRIFLLTRRGHAQHNILFTIYMHTFCLVFFNEYQDSWLQLIYQNVLNVNPTLSFHLHLQIQCLFLSRLHSFWRWKNWVVLLKKSVQ